MLPQTFSVGTSSMSILRQVFESISRTGIVPSTAAAAKVSEITHYTQHRKLYAVTLFALDHDVLRWCGSIITQLARVSTTF